MKQKLFYLAAMFFFIACSTDQTVEVSENPADLISFRPYINNVTRAADVTTDNLTTFKVNARKSTGNVEYFKDAVFTGSSTTPFTCSDKHYWPQSEALDFYAYSPTSNAQVVVDATDYYKKFTVTPSTTIADQVDFVFASTKSKTKAGSTSGGITLNFRHTGAKIACKVKNTSSTLKFDVEGWKVGFLSPTGTFTFADADTDGQNTGTGTTLTFGQWGNHTAAAVATEYVSTLASTANIAANAAATALDGEMILVPQTLTAATAYASAAASANLNGSFIAVKLKIRNNDAAGTIIADDGGNAFWAIWPIGGYNLEPGKKYTFTIDLAGGGYFETNKDGDADLDPVLDGAEIKFVSVTVDGWTNKFYPESLADLKSRIGVEDCSSYVGKFVDAGGNITSNTSEAIGVICYIGSSDVDRSFEGSRIIIASYNDASSGSPWASGGMTTTTVSSQYYYPDISNTSLRNGYNNTQKLVTIDATNHPAANAAWTYQSKSGTPVITGSSGWFLPSKAQWDLIIENNANITLKTLITGGYWTSTEDMGTRSYRLSYFVLPELGVAQYNTYVKTSENKVKAIYVY